MGIPTGFICKPTIIANEGPTGSLLMLSLSVSHEFRHSIEGVNTLDFGIGGTSTSSW